MGKRTRFCNHILQEGAVMKNILIIVLSVVAIETLINKVEIPRTIKDIPAQYVWRDTIYEDYFVSDDFCEVYQRGFKIDSTKLYTKTEYYNLWGKHMYNTLKMQ